MDPSKAPHQTTSVTAGRMQMLLGTYGFTPEELSEKAGVSPKDIRAILAEDFSTDIAVIAQIAVSCNIPIDYFCSTYGDDQIDLLFAKTMLLPEDARNEMISFFDDTINKGKSKDEIFERIETRILRRAATPEEKDVLEQLSEILSM